MSLQREAVHGRQLDGRAGSQRTCSTDRTAVGYTRLAKSSSVGLRSGTPSSVSVAAASTSTRLAMRDAFRETAAVALEQLGTAAAACWRHTVFMATVFHTQPTLQLAHSSGKRLSMTLTDETCYLCAGVPKSQARSESEFARDACGIVHPLWTQASMLRQCVDSADGAPRAFVYRGAIVSRLQAIVSRLQ